jgi:hypothetical protein
VGQLRLLNLKEGEQTFYEDHLVLAEKCFRADVGPDARGKSRSEGFVVLER